MYHIAYFIFLIVQYFIQRNLSLQLYKVSYSVIYLCNCTMVQITYFIFEMVQFFIQRILSQWWFNASHSFFLCPCQSKNGGRAWSFTPVWPCIRVRLVIPKSCRMYSWNVTDDKSISRQWMANKVDSGLFGFQAITIYPCPFVQACVRAYVHVTKLCPAITPKRYGIYSWNFTDDFIILRRCAANNEENSDYFDFGIIPLV